MPSGVPPPITPRVNSPASSSVDFLDRALEPRHATGDRSAFERRTGRARRRKDPLLVAEDQLRVRPDVHDGHEAVFVGQADRQHARRRIGPDVSADDREAVDAGLGMDREQAAPSRLGQAGRRSSSRLHVDLGDRAVGALSNRVHVLAKEDVAHRGIAHDDDLVDRPRIDRKLLDRVGEIAGERPPEQLASVFGVVVDARHHVGSAESLRILERRVGHELAGLEVDQANDNRRRTEIHREPVDRAARFVEHLAADPVDDPAALSYHRGIDRHLRLADRQVQRVALDAHVTAPHRVALDSARVGDDATLT